MENIIFVLGFLLLAASIEVWRVQRENKKLKQDRRERFEVIAKAIARGEIDSDLLSKIVLGDKKILVLPKLLEAIRSDIFELSAKNMDTKNLQLLASELLELERGDSCVDAEE